MSDSQDIRDWARDQGIEVSPKGPVRADIKTKYYEDHPDEFAELQTAEAERAPEDIPGGKGGFSWGRRKPATDNSKAKPRRTSIEGIVASVWGFGAMMVASKAQLIPVARVLDMQAPVAGVIINDIAKGTVVDKVLQPFARAGDKGQEVFGLIGPPMITMAILSKPEMYPILRPMLKSSLMTWMEVSEPAMKKVIKRQEQFAERFGEIDLDGMIDNIFAPPPGYVPAPEDGGENASGD